MILDIINNFFILLFSPLFVYYIKNLGVALRINTAIYCVDFYFSKQYIMYKNFSATPPFIF